MMRSISTRQLIIFYCIYSFSIKFLSLPSLLTQTAGRDAWISALLGIVVELLLLFCTLSFVAKKNKTDIYSDLRRNNNFNYIFSKIVMLAFLAIFVYQIVILADQTFKLVGNNLFENLNPFMYFAPLVLFGLFFCFEPSRAIFRSGEVFFIFIIFGIILSVFPALTHIDVNEITPVLENGFAPVIKATLMNAVYFESFLFLLLYKGEISGTRHLKKKFMLTASLLGLFFVFFVFMFYSLFGPLAEYKDIAITNFTVYSSYITTSGRLDWVLVTMWLLLLLLRFGVTCACAFKCFKHILKGVKHA